MAAVLSWLSAVVCRWPGCRAILQSPRSFGTFLRFLSHRSALSYPRLQRSCRRYRRRHGYSRRASCWTVAGWLVQRLWLVIPAAFSCRAFPMPMAGHNSPESSASTWATSRRPIRLIHLTFRFPACLFAIGGPTDTFAASGLSAAWLWPVPAALLIGSSLRRMDTTVQQQALLDGALRRITFRQLSGPIIASVAIVTILATQEFSVYEKPGISVVATEVRMVFDSGTIGSPSQSDRRILRQRPSQGARRIKPAGPPPRSPRRWSCSHYLALGDYSPCGRARSTSAVDSLGVSGGDWPPILDASTSRPRSHAASWCSINWPSPWPCDLCLT